MALLGKLVEIALEGEAAGDAPWAAANVIAEYPSALLRAHENSLRKIAAESWVYLSRPATAARQHPLPVRLRSAEAASASDQHGNRVPSARSRGR